MYGRSDLRNPPSYMSQPEENKRDKRIYGLELEANDKSSWLHFTEAVDNNKIYLQGKSESYTRDSIYIAAKYDCTAQYELVFQAERPRNIYKGLRNIGEYLNPNTINNLNAGENDNENDCSAHIHINNKYLDDRGIYYSELAKASELLAPYLFVMSGRVNRFDGSMEWAQSILNHDGMCDIFTHPQVRAKYIEDLDADCRLTNRGRYKIMNTPTHHHTSELRLFTNKCSFNYNRIKLFVETADFLIDVADNYQGVDYTICYAEIIDDFRKFLLRYKRRREEVKKMGLEFIHQGVKGYNKFIFKNRHLINFNGGLENMLRTIRNMERNHGISYDEPISLAYIDAKDLEEYYLNKLADNEILNTSSY